MKGLEKRLVKCMNEKVTFVGFGALEIGRNWGLGTGINIIDTASAYHRSEERIGKGIREKEVIKKLLALVDYDAGTLTSLALNFLYQKKGISSVLLGTKNVKHLKDNFELLKKI